MIWGVVAGIALVACPDVCHAGFVVAKGYDLFSVAPGTTLFGYDFAGVPAPYGTWFGRRRTDLGNTSVILHRTSSVTGSSGGTASVGVRMDYLVLRSADKINFMGKGNDYYYITLESARKSTGAYTIHFDSTGNSGTFDLTVTFKYAVRKHAKGGRVVSRGAETLSVTGVHWSRDPVTGTLTINGVNYHLDGSNNAQDFFPSLWPATFTLGNGSDSLVLASPHRW